MPFGDVRVYDDYGHHPTEIRVTLRAIREASAPRRLVCVFQPHQHSRTRLLMDEFARAFGDADLVLLPDIHFVRDPEEERSKVSSEILAERLRAEGTSALAVGTLAAAAERARASLQAGDVLVTMGAGSVWKVARELVQGGSDHAG
jgi:UDP-N-acetylmuramate--alanine ligase